MPAPTVIKNKPKSKPTTATAASLNSAPSAAPATTAPVGPVELSTVPTEIVLPKVEKPIDDVPEAFRDWLVDLVQQRRGLAVMAKQSEAGRKALDEQIKSIMLDNSIKKVTGFPENYYAVVCKGRSQSILSKTKLLEMGVSADVIKACTVPGTPYTYVQVTRKGEEEDPRGDEG